MKLWQALDPEAQAILCTPAGAESFLLSFSPAQRDSVAQATAQALDSEVADDISPEDALSLFSALVGQVVTPAPSEPLIRRPRPS